VAPSLLFFLLLFTLTVEGCATPAGQAAAIRGCKMGCPAAQLLAEDKCDGELDAMITPPAEPSIYYDYCIASAASAPATCEALCEVIPLREDLQDPHEGTILIPLEPPNSDVLVGEKTWISTDPQA
jgi:hypothetical protein